MAERGANITLLDDDGVAHEFTLVDVIEVEARRYAVLQPEDPEEGAVVFRVEGETLLPVEDDEEFDRVVEALRALEDYEDLVVADGEEEEVEAAVSADGQDEADEDDEDGEDDDDGGDDEDEASPGRRVN